MNYPCDDCSVDVCYSCLKIRDWAQEHHDKYRWHDLRKNPDDLTDPDIECEVVVKRTYSDYRMIEHARRIELSDAFYWYVEHYGYVQHPKYKNGYGGDNTIEVITWREVETFEETEDEIRE